MLKLINRFSLFIISMAFALIAYGAQPLDRIVAQVNNQVITQSQVEKAMALVKIQMKQMNTPIPNDNVLQKKILDNLINSKLELEVAERAKIKISDAELDKSIANIAAKNHMTLAQMKAAMSQQGINYADYRHQIREQMTIATVQREALGSELNISDKDVQAFLHSPEAKNTANIQYHLVDVLIPLPDNATPAQIDDIKKQADTIANKWRKDEDISPLPIQTNDLGWRHISDLPTPFVKVVPSMKVGAIASPLQAPNGFHILKLVEKQGTDTLTAEQAKEILFQKKFPKILEAWLQKMRTAAYVKVML